MQILASPDENTNIKAHRVTHKDQLTMNIVKSIEIISSLAGIVRPRKAESDIRTRPGCQSFIRQLAYTLARPTRSGGKDRNVLTWVTLNYSLYLACSKMMPSSDNSRATTAKVTQLQASILSHQNDESYPDSSRRSNLNQLILT